MTTSGDINEIAAALAKAQGAFTVPKKSHTAKVATRTGGQYTYAYSTLDELIDATRPALVANGLATLQNITMPGEGNVAVSTRVLHASGQWIEFDPVVMPAGETPQSVGAAVTYARRYSMGAALNVAAEEDNDAEPGAQEPQAVSTAPSSPRPHPDVRPPSREAESTPPERRAVASGHGTDLLISEPQAKRLYAIAKDAGWDDADLKAWLEEVWGMKSSKLIPRRQYEEIVNEVRRGPVLASEDGQ